MLYPDETGVILHRYLPITATSLHLPFSSVLNMAVLEGFDCVVYKRGQIVEVYAISGFKLIIKSHLPDK